LIEHGLTSAPT